MFLEPLDSIEFHWILLLVVCLRVFILDEVFSIQSSDFLRLFLWSIVPSDDCWDAFIPQEVSIDFGKIPL